MLGPELRQFLVPPGVVGLDAARRRLGSRLLQRARCVIGQVRGRRTCCCRRLVLVRLGVRSDLHI
jgi:hypothetical protein